MSRAAPLSYQVRGSCAWWSDRGGDELKGCVAWRVHLLPRREGDGVDGLVGRCVWCCVVEVAFRGRVGECEGEWEGDGRPNWTDRVAEGSFVPLAIWTSASEDWNVGFLVDMGVRGYF